MGRPTKLDDLTAKRIVDAIRRGVSRRAAANGANVSYTALKNWLAAGREGEPLYAAFLARVEEAESKAEGEMVDALFAAAKDGKYQAAQFWLTSRRAAEWAARTAADAESEASADVTADDLETARAVVSALESRKVG